MTILIVVTVCGLSYRLLLAKKPNYQFVKIKRDKR